jgi:hypothetical protein
MAFDLLIGVGSLVIGVVLLVVAMPKKSGEPKGFIAASPGLAITYPVLPLLFLVIGGSMLITALF